jgi:hypothetical protein
MIPAIGEGRKNFELTLIIMGHPGGTEQAKAVTGTVRCEAHVELTFSAQGAALCPPRAVASQRR